VGEVAGEERGRILYTAFCGASRPHRVPIIAVVGVIGPSPLKRESLSFTVSSPVLFHSGSFSSRAVGGGDFLAWCSVFISSPPAMATKGVSPIPYLPRFILFLCSLDFLVWWVRPSRVFMLVRGDQEY
jgi:hypothetical protein